MTYLYYYQMQSIVQAVARMSLSAASDLEIKV